MKAKKIFIALIAFCMFVICSYNLIAAENDNEVQMADYVNKDTGAYDTKYTNIPADTANRGSVLGQEHSHGYIFWVSFNNRSYISYCIGYGRAISAEDVLQAWPDKDLISASGKVISDEVIEQLEYVLKYGFVLDTSYLSGGTAAESFMRDYMNNTDSAAQDKYFATQTVMWATADGYFNDYDRMVQIITSFCNGKNDNGNPLNRALDIYDKAYKAYNACKDEKADNFDKTYKMTWDEDEGVYKAVITEDDYKYMLDNVITGKVTSSNSNLKFKVEENKITITSSTVVGSESSPVNCTFTRKVGDNEGTVFFGQADTSAAGDDPQPVAVFRESDIQDETHNFKVYTDAGSLKIKKVDTYGVAHSGAKFNVTGNGLEWNITTGSDGTYTISNIPSGTYTITETSAPDGMIIEEDKKTSTVKVSSGETVTYTKENPYPKGSVSLVKYDADNRGNTLGDATLAGAVFNLYAAEDIYEGTTKVYSKDQVVKENIVTDGNGETSKVSDLPVGKYYYKEIKASEGFNINSNIVEVEISFGGQSVEVIAEQTVEISEKPIYGDIEITKKLSATDYDPEITIDGAQFKATLINDRSQVYYSNISGEDGICKIEDLPYGTYEIEECIVPVEGLKVANFNVKIEEDGKVYTYEKIDPSKTIGIKIRKEDADRKEDDAPDYTQGDAHLDGAEYTLYRDENLTQVVDVLRVDHKDSEGYWCAESGTIRCGTYYVKETKAPEGYLPDENVYVYSQPPENQDVEYVQLTQVSKEVVMRGSLEVIKQDNILGQTEEAASKGAILRLTLNSNPDKYYDVTIDEYGYGEFVEEESREKYYPYTIPYGKYTISEIKESDSGESTHWFIQPEEVVIDKQGKEEYRIESDEPLEIYLQVQKTDKDTGATVNLAGAEFKIWDCQNNEWVERYDTSADENITTFVTNSEGYFVTPQALLGGDYIIYEIKAPEGYYLQDEWRLPENENDIGVIGKGGYYVRLDKAATGIETDEPAHKVELFYEADIPNEPLKGRLEITKTAEKLVDVSMEQTEYGVKYTPVWDNLPVEGVSYEIYAAEDIKSPDGRVTYVQKGTKVQTITTGVDGIATSGELYLGEYEIREVDAPDGVIINNDIDNVVLENDNELVRVDTTEQELTNKRQKLLISLEKTFEDVNFSNGETIEQKAVFGVYANEDIKTVNGNIIIRKDDLVDLIEVNGNGDVTSKIDLPEGNYYVKEISVSYPYTVSDNIQEVEVRYDGNDREFLTYELEGVVNDYDEASITLIKLSSSSLGDLILNGDETVVENIDEKVNQLLDEIRGMTDEEIEEYLNENQIQFVPGAKYKIYTDEECTKPLYIKQEGEEVFKEAELITNDTGMIKLENVPLGVYYLKEVEAPQQYEETNSVIRIELTQNNQNQMVYRALVENSLKTAYLTKVDIFTGEEIPNCEFEIRNENGDVILHSITDEKGSGYIPLDLFEEGKTYTYKEISAPEKYTLNEKEFEFTAHFDDEGNWAVEKQVVDNTRKISTVTLEKIDSADLTTIPNCKFELRSLETDYVLEGVTDENGICIFENVPYGKYTFKEIEVPEGYIIDTEEHEIEIDSEDMKIRVTNDKAPETGDIAVLTLVAVATICIAGIAFVIIKNKRLSKNN